MVSSASLAHPKPLDFLKGQRPSESVLKFCFSFEKLKQNSSIHVYLYLRDSLRPILI